MKAIIASDNHGDLKVLKKLEDMYFNDVDIFIHCGDFCVADNEMNNWITVRGNNDYASNAPQSRVITWENKKILITHGDRLIHYNNYQNLLYQAKSLNCDIVCFGHTHIYENLKIDDIILINPGSLYLNRDGLNPSYIYLKIENNEIFIERREI